MMKIKKKLTLLMGVAVTALLFCSCTTEKQDNKTILEKDTNNMNPEKILVGYPEIKI